MKLVIFDIDGTLTATSKTDADCYVQAIRDVFGLEVDDSDWSRFRNYTDSGIFAEVFEKQNGRPPSVEEDRRLQRHFLQLLKKTFAEEPDLFTEVPGAGHTLQHLRRQEDWAVAMATGCWRCSAEFKLDCARLEAKDLPLATCDGMHRREEIMREAVTLAESANNVITFDRIVYVGDGVWDARGSRNLGFHFVGIQHENHHRTLADEGASHILPSYLDLSSFLRALEDAQIPV